MSRQCVCVFTNDELIEKFHHFLHAIISAGINLIQHLSSDDVDSASGAQLDDASYSVRDWPFDSKEKLLIALVKIFSFNMPLYVTYKHLLFNHGRYTRSSECSCSRLSTDSVALLQLYCPTNSNRNQVVKMVIIIIIVEIVI